MNEEDERVYPQEVSRERVPNFLSLPERHRIHAIHRPTAFQEVSADQELDWIKETHNRIKRMGFTLKVVVGYSCDPITIRIMRRYGIMAYTVDQLTARPIAESGWSEWREGLVPNPSSWHIQTDATEFGRAIDWSFGIFHPPCTYLTTSGAWAFKDGPYHQRIKPGTLVGAARRKARDEALGLVSNLLNLPFPTVVENPAKSYICSNIAKPSRIIHHYQFGHDAAKATGLWFSKSVPRLIPTTRIRGQYIGGREVFANQTDKGQNRMTEDEDRWRQRSITYPGIAEAMGHQYAQWLLRSVGLLPTYVLPRD